MQGKKYYTLELNMMTDIKENISKMPIHLFLQNIFKKQTIQGIWISDDNNLDFIFHVLIYSSGYRMVDVVISCSDNKNIIFQCNLIKVTTDYFIIDLDSEKFTIPISKIKVAMRDKLCESEIYNKVITVSYTLNLRN